MALDFNSIPRADSPKGSPSKGLRTGIAALVLSAGGLVGILSHESYSPKAYIPVPGDVPTIGYGTTQGVHLGQTTTPVRALQRAQEDIVKYEGAVKECVKVPLYQWEYDAYMSLAYNIGTGAFCKSTLVKKLNSQDYVGACQEILRFNKMGGKVLPGLTSRRKDEYQKCIGVK